ncbi:RRM 5 and RRM 1 domain containing protein [Trichuris trichiura]|uniref:RRM 5 and RRM 1 domain containing protein n=1 Tax=Trichuris trichiura TaxID=36087 RepID=A0A077Z582_TRITR|nr:RRM 5 and RRM 1 domain containing protein [Trichuris trichiura]
MSAHGADCGPVAKRYSICVRQLPLRSSDSSIKEGLYFNFKKYGKVVAVKVIGSQEDRYALVSFRRYVTIHFFPEIDARSAVAKCGQDRFFGRKIVAELAPEDMDGDDNERRPLEKDIDQYHPKSSRTLYVGNLWNGITPEVLKEQFSAYGTVLDIEIKNKETPAPFCFIQYADISSVVNAVLALEIDGYVGKNKVKVGFGKPLPTPTVWIDGLQPDITEAYLTRKMNFYGAIKDVLIDRTSGQALVTYDGVEAATNAVQDMKGRTIDNQRVRIDFCSRELHDLMVDRMYGTKQLDSSDSQAKPSKQVQQALQDYQTEMTNKLGLPDEQEKKKCQHNRDSRLIPSIPLAAGSDAVTNLTPVQGTIRETATLTLPAAVTSPAPPEVRSNSRDERSPASDEQNISPKLSKLPQVEQTDDATKAASKLSEVQMEVGNVAVRKENSPELSAAVAVEERSASATAPVHQSPLVEKDSSGKQSSSSSIPTGALWVVPGAFQRIPVTPTELCAEPRDLSLLMSKPQTDPVDFILPDFVATMKHKVGATLKREEEPSGEPIQNPVVAELEEGARKVETNLSPPQTEPPTRRESSEAPVRTQIRFEELKRTMNCIEEKTEKMISEHIQHRRDVFSHLNAKFLRTGAQSPVREEEPPEFMVNLAKELDGQQPPVPLKEFCEKTGSYFLSIIEQSASALSSKMPVQGRCRTYEAHGDALADQNDWTAKIAQLKKKFYTAQALSRVNDNWNKEMNEPQPPDQQTPSVEETHNKSVGVTTIREEYEQPHAPLSTPSDSQKNEQKSLDLNTASADSLVSVESRSSDHEESAAVPFSAAAEVSISKVSKKPSRPKRLYVSESSDLEHADGSKEILKKRPLTAEGTRHSEGNYTRKGFQRYFDYAVPVQEKRQRLSSVSDSDQSESPSDVRKIVEIDLPSSDIPSDAGEPCISALASPEEELQMSKCPSRDNVVSDMAPSESEDSASEYRPSESVKSFTSVETVNLVETVDEQLPTSCQAEPREDGNAAEELQVDQVNSTACLQLDESVSKEMNDAEAHIATVEPGPAENISPIVIEETLNSHATSVCDLQPSITSAHVEPVTSAPSMPASVLTQSAPVQTEALPTPAVSTQQITVSTFASSSTDVHQTLLAQAASHFPISFGDAGNVAAPWSQAMTMPQLMARPGFMDRPFAPSGPLLGPPMPYPFVRLQQNPFNSPIFPMDQTRLMANFSPFATGAPGPTVAASPGMPFACTVHLSVDDIIFAEITTNIATLGPRSLQFRFDRVQNPLVVLVMSYLPYASQDSNFQMAIMELSSRHPLVWDGILYFRRHELRVQLFHISGNVTAGPIALAAVAENNNGRALLRVAQRVVFNEETMKTMIVRNGTFLLCLIGGAPINQMASQWQIMREYLCNYLAEKAASGIIVNQPQEIAITVSPPTPFVRTYVQQKASGIYDVLARSEIPFLFVGVTKYA